MTDPGSVRLQTARLVLRPTAARDAGRAFEIQSDWNVTRMLAMAGFPPDRNEIDQWFAAHPHEWRAGEAFRFAVEREERLIGVVDVDAICDGGGSLGYWFEQSSWGRGVATEAARAVVDFAFREVGLSQLRAGHAADNPSSGRVLVKLGFRHVDTIELQSRSRGEIIAQCRYTLRRPTQL
ncbi:MAG: GNAT family N-acetyltransferase [Enhydrobacter sp.]|nr:MAG: GNAT family N-acetyltransferase [Enhydrobacter sp.]